ncbi:PAS domain S-box protein [Pseudodesulfovibrio cashew]|uniref:Sensory/regulatory protein RpfC n=2 Tax=Pseudodesulfovibrio cashew TaxID=2678688 RepID=A0A6I6JGH0_9BACT|nr:PAS domain S-box protein [Pseudodesulfovibrio cashew]
MIRRGYRVTEADNGTDGVEAFTLDKPDVVLVALRLSGMSGVAVVAELAERGPELPLIALSEGGELKDAVRSMRQGAWDIVAKGEGMMAELDQALVKGFERAAFLRRQKAELEAEVRERKLAEDRFRTMLEVSPQPVVIVNLENGRCVFANHAAAEQLGVAPGEAEGLRARTFFDEANVHGDVRGRLLRDGHLKEVELELCRKDGSVFWVQASASLMSLDGRRVAYVSFIDISARMELVDALRKFKFIANASHDSMTLANRDYVYEAVNRAYLDQTWGTDKDILGRNMVEIWGEKNFEQNIRHHFDLCLTGRTVVYRAWFAFPGQETRYYEVFMYPYGRKKEEITHVATVSRDITESAEAEARIMQTREYFQAIFESSLDPILLFDEDLNILDMNTAATARFIGVSGKKRLGLTKLFPDEAGQEFRSMVMPALKSLGSWFGVWSFVDINGESIPTETAISALPQRGNARPCRYVAVVRDISPRLKAEARRRETEERYRAVFEFTGAATVLINEKGLVVKANQRFAELYGQDREEIEGRLDWIDYVAEEDRERLLGQRQKRLRAGCGAVTEYEFRFVSHDGEVRDACSLVSQMPDGKESIASITDISERKYNETVAFTLYRVSNAVSTTPCLDELYKRIHSILCDIINAENFFIAELDKSRRFLEFPYFEDAMDNCKGVVFDTWDDEVTSLSVEVLRLGRPLLVKDVDHSVAMSRRCLDDASIKIECVARNELLRRKGAAEGSMFGSSSKDWLGVPIKVKGEGIGVLAVQSYDDPEQYSARDVELLVSVAEQVALAIERRANERDLLSAKELAEAANLTKNEFLANMSHEVRTPLNGVLGMLQLAKTTPLSREQRDYVDTALASGRSLLSIINDILDLTKIEAGRLEIACEPFSPRHLVRDVIATFRHDASDKHITLEADLSSNLPDLVVGGKGRLRQILFNLVGNSVKFTEKGKITVSMLPMNIDHEAGKVRMLVSVADTGIGIPDDMISHVFEPFTQVDGSSVRQHQGSGLGLGIVRRLASLMGGYLSVDTMEGEGTTVYLTLTFDLDPAGAERSCCLYNASGRQDSMHFLVVEDNRINRLLAIRMIGKLGHTEESAKDGNEALEKLRESHFDAVFTDIQMPGMDGLELTRRIRASEPGSDINPDIWIIAMTAHAMSGDREHFLAKGIDDYIAKPLEMDDIQAAVARLYASRQP